MPGVELRGTGERSEILFHPGHEFKVTTGCINLVGSLADPSHDIDFADSRDRVVA